MRKLETLTLAAAAILATLTIGGEAAAQCTARVQTGSTTSTVALAQRCGTSVGEIRRANPGRNLNRPGLVTVPGGTRSVVPDSLNNDVAPRRRFNSTSQQPIRPAPGEPAPTMRQGLAGTGSGGVYTIRSGDTLSGIAAQRGIGISALIAANPGISPRRLSVGQEIRLPAS